MNFNPIVRRKMEKFASEKNYTHLEESELFERFVNYHIIYSHQPNAFFGNSDILEYASIGGRDDTAIDGFCIKINGYIIKDFDEFKSIAEKAGELSIEFIFIQAKLTSNTKMSDFNNFTTGIRNFFENEQFLPCNENIRKAIDLKDKVLSDEYIQKWDDSSPSVRAYYVNMGQGATPHTKGIFSQFKKDLSKLNIFADENIQVVIVGEHELRKICNANDDTFSATLKFIQEMPLSEVEGVQNSCIILCYADEFVKLIKLDDGSLRKVAFTDNVRDFQGATSINKEIQSTILDAPERFSLFNNGITVVCDTYTPKSRTLHIVNPQVVNGCQTSSVLYYSSLKTDISKVPLVVKIIATSDDDITNLIVRGTNRQNIVYDESFEITRSFHKELEEYFNAMEFSGIKIYYERRSKQFASHQNIDQLQKFSFKNLIQITTATLLEEPHISHKHESVLIKQTRERIFKDNHSKYAYFSVCIIYYTLLKYFRDNRDIKKIYFTYIFHILFIVYKLLLMNHSPDLSDRKRCESVYKKALEKIVSEGERFIKESFSIFDDSCKEWIEVKKESKFSIKEHQNFVDLLKENTKEDSLEFQTKKINIGKVITVKRDIRGQFYGFIETSRERLFFHEKSSPQLSWENILGSTVSYIFGMSNRDEPMAIDVKLFDTL